MTSALLETLHIKINYHSVRCICCIMQYTKIYDILKIHIKLVKRESHNLL